MPGAVVPGRVLIPPHPIIRFGRHRRPKAMGFAMIDLIYIGGGVAVLLIYALYAAALRKV